MNSFFRNNIETTKQDNLTDEELAAKLANDFSNDTFTTLVEDFTPEFNPVEANHKTRSNIAELFVKWYVWLILLLFSVTILFNASLLLVGSGLEEYLINIEDTLMILQSLLGTPLGFVVGYYFRTQDE